MPTLWFQREISETSICGQNLVPNLETQFRSSPPCDLVHQVKQEKEMIGHVSFDDINPSLFLNFWNNGRARLLVKMSAAWFSVNFDSFFGNFSWNPEISNFNVLCSCDAFDWADNLSCTWIITENWSIFVIEDSFVIFVGRMDNILQEFYFCDFLEQSIKLSSCGTSWDVILFP